MAEKNKQSVFVPFGSLNQDDSIVTPIPTPAGIKSPFELGDYRYALNARIGSSKSNNFGDIENLKGTDQVTTYILPDGITPGAPPSGTNKTIGKYEDYEFQCIYMFNWNSNNNDTITRWDVSTNTIYELLRLDLSWESTYFVKAAKLDNWMAFTDRNNNPRLIDTDTIAAMFNTYGASNFREFHLSHHKWAPIMPPIPRVYDDGVTNNFDILKNKAYQFAYQYIYKGNLKSRFSPISKAAVTARGGVRLIDLQYVSGFITSIEVDIPGMILDVPGANVEYNYFDHTNTKFSMSVDSIVLAYREGELDVWKIWKTVPVSSFTRLQYFDGDANNTIIPDEDFYQPFDAVPFKAGTVEAIDNRFVYGDCLNEQVIPTDLVVTDLAVVTDPLNDWRSDIPGDFASLSAPQRDDLLRRNSLSQFTFKSRAKYKVCIQYFHPSGWRSLGLTTDVFQYTATDVSVSRLLAFNFKIDAAVDPPDWAVAYQIMRTNALTIDMFVLGVANQFIPLIDSVDTILNRISIPDNVKAVIRDHFANSKTVSSYEAADFTKKAIQNEINARNASYKNDKFNKLLDLNENIGIGSGFPELALSNKVLNKVLRHNPIKGDLSAEILTVTNTTTLADCSRIMIDINNWYNAAKITDTQDQPTINKLYYNFRNGDRVRFIGSDVAEPMDSDKKTYDVPIITFTGKGLLIERPKDLLWLPDTASTSVTDFNIEVYTPKIPNEEDAVLYETGEVYPILYPGHVSRDFSKRDWTYVDNNSVTGNAYGPWNIFNKLPFYYADVLSVGRPIYRDTISGYGGATVTGNTAQSMNPDPSFNYDYWDRYNGRPVVTYRDIPPVKFFNTQCRFGGKIVEESLINQINRYRAEDQFIYPSEYGRIRNLINTANAQVESVGSILLAIGEREAWSIYVNRTTIEDLSGNTQVGLSDKVLGSYNTLLGSHGTMNPESVSIHKGRVYWWDAVDGSWIRYGRDGLTAISDYKMRNWYREISDILITQYLTSTPPVVISSFDSFNEELVTFINHSSLPGTFRGYDTYKGAMFSEKDTGWKSIHSYTPEMFARMNNKLVSMKGGILYTHETSSTYNTFYGVKYNSEIEPVFNDGFTNVKHWQTISILSTNRWSVERMLSEYRGLRALIQSRILIDQFEEFEDTYWAAIKGDINTPNIANPIVNGNKMRSKAIQVLFRLDPSVTYLSLLHTATAGYIESPKNP